MFYSYPGYIPLLKRKFNIIEPIQKLQVKKNVSLLFLLPVNCPAFLFIPFGDSKTIHQEQKRFFAVIL